MKNKKGFTLAELLIVIAIIAVLVGIMFPVFSGQTEKARDAVSLANLRSAYAEACTAYLLGEDSENITLKPGVKEGDYFVTVENVELQGKKADKFSGNVDSLPFIIFPIEDPEPEAGTYSVIFDFSGGSGTDNVIAYIH